VNLSTIDKVKLIRVIDATSQLTRDEKHRFTQEIKQSGRKVKI